MAAAGVVGCWLQPGLKRLGLPRGRKELAPGPVGLLGEVYSVEGGENGVSQTLARYWAEFGEFPERRGPLEWPLQEPSVWERSAIIKGG